MNYRELRKERSNSLHASMCFGAQNIPIKHGICLENGILTTCVPGGSAFDRFGLRRRMVRPSRFGPRRQTILNSTMADSAHANSRLLSSGILRIVVSAHGLVR